jgi:hypothetical protein
MKFVIFSILMFSSLAFSQERQSLNCEGTNPVDHRPMYVKNSWQVMINNDGLATKEDVISVVAKLFPNTKKLREPSSGELLLLVELPADVSPAGRESFIGDLDTFRNLPGIVIVCNSLLYINPGAGVRNIR